jgi:hypothetical protein
MTGALAGARSAGNWSRLSGAAPAGRGSWAAAAILSGSAAGAVFDELSEPAAWTGPVFQYGNPATGKAWFANGVLKMLIHRPGESNELPETFRKLARRTPSWRLLGPAAVSGTK